MAEQNVPVMPLPGDPGLDVEYLLKELEFQFAIETRARDRMENMVQYLLTTIAAVIGAALLVNELQVNSILLLFIASLLMFLFSASAFYRSLRLRHITTYARVTRNNIRCMLERLGVVEANRLIELEGHPSGFGERMLGKLNLLLIFCCLLGGVTGFLALLSVFSIKRWPIHVTDLQRVLLIVIPLVLMIGIWLILASVLRIQKSRSDLFLQKFSESPEWQSLPDYDL
jgi:hypothetical protein